jgi:aromatic ring-opening dioxygenase LigB subunit
MTIAAAVLMCHAPIVLPEVGRDRAADCAPTTAAMRAAASALLAHAPEVLVIVSPHTPRRRDGWSIVDNRLAGDFAEFGAPEVKVDLPVAPEADLVHRAAASRGLRTYRSRLPKLDHGALVPLHFVQEAGWRGPTLLLAFPGEPTDAAAMGEAVAEAAARTGKRGAFLASGDMSHRLIPGAPAGHDPRAREFDAAFVERIQAGDLRGAVAIDPALRELAAEDVVDSVAVAAGATGWSSARHRFLAYEGPFGVGYCEAVLYENGA